MAGYNCSDSANSSYGAGAFGTCAEQTSQSVNAPNTGFFQEVINGGSFTIVAPLIAAIIVVLIASLAVRYRKKA